MDVLLPREPARAGPGRWLWLLLVLTGLALLVVAGYSAWSRQAASAMAPARSAQGPVGLVVPSPNDAAWTEFYRNARDGVSMAVHLPVARDGDMAVAWQKFVERRRAVVALAEIHYDCVRHTRRSARMAVYRNGALNGVADLPGESAAVPVQEGTVEQDALALACSGRIPEQVDDDS